MRAKFILLNHFSQRYARLPYFDTFQEDIAPTFDFLRVFGSVYFPSLVNSLVLTNGFLHSNSGFPKPIVSLKCVLSLCTQPIGRSGRGPET